MALKPRISFITLGVRDVAASKAFYVKLGLQLHPMSNDNVGFFDVNGTVLGIYGHNALAEDAKIEPQPQQPYRGTSIAWNGSSEAEVDQIFAHAITCGATEVKRPEKVFWGGYSGYFADPDNHLWEVAYNPFIKITAEGHVQLP